jgi:hypothetical protein
MGKNEKIKCRHDCRVAMSVQDPVKNSANFQIPVCMLFADNSRDGKRKMKNERRMPKNTEA